MDDGHRRLLEMTEVVTRAMTRATASASARARVRVRVRVRGVGG